VELDKQVRQFKEEGKYIEHSALKNELSTIWRCCYPLVIVVVLKIIHAISVGAGRTETVYPVGLFPTPLSNVH